MVLPPRSIESNAPVAQRDDTRSPGSAAVPFATYLVAMHQRIHPIFTDQTAISRALTEPRAVDEDRVTVLEIVLSAAEGRLVRIGVVKASGVTAVDLIALGAVFHAQPFGKAPDSLVSPDGNVHMHWEFHSDPHDGCAPRNAYPYLLKSAP